MYIGDEPIGAEQIQRIARNSKGNRTITIAEEDNNGQNRGT